MKDADSVLQKKAYRILCRICNTSRGGSEGSVGFVAKMVTELRDTLLDALPHCSASAKKVSPLSSIHSFIPSSIYAQSNKRRKECDGGNAGFVAKMVVELRDTLLDALPHCSPAAKKVSQSPYVDARKGRREVACDVGRGDEGGLSFLGRSKEGEGRNLFLDRSHGRWVGCLSCLVSFSLFLSDSLAWNVLVLSFVIFLPSPRILLSWSLYSPPFSVR